ncbi:LysR family transcriptional regulator [Arthrobacter sp. MYb23]|uniref:LysR family transcriptional regulator n=1 Tax=unclassified Arthrobacter TaxID=235627 RepID=UPI000CFBE148|nr:MULTISPECIES: LysR family transcriptional regulator [unclassified Arthrobacter]PRB40095.1 LysR family transcriptional regulator [Arthrobacter sp. MYb51]PRB93443.1 LysR family transcriptional regulator [Arthrobacter sp. MYb23]
MNISLDRLEAFVTVCEAGSFSAAARRLNRSQSSLSGAIAQLEIEIGVDLFDRTTRIPTITEAGQRLVLDARTVIERARAFELQADAFATGTAHTMTISVNIPLRMISEPLKEFGARFPHVNLVVQNPADQRPISDYVLSGSTAMGVCFTLPNYPRSLDFRRLGNLILVHVAHKDHPLARRELVKFEDLREHRRLVYADQANVHPTGEYLRNAQVWQIFDYGPLVELTRAGLGWGTVPRQFILQELASGELVELRLEAYQHTDWLVGVDLLYSLERRPTEPELWLRNRLASHVVSERPTSSV